MAKAWTVFAFLLAGGCSPSEEGEVRAPMASGSELARLELSGEKPAAGFDLRSPCEGDLVVEVGELPEAEARSYLLTVSAVYGDEKRRIAAHTPYPTGAPANVLIPRDACAGARRIEIEAQPIHGELKRGFRLPVVVKAAGPKRGG